MLKYSICWNSMWEFLHGSLPSGAPNAICHICCKALSYECLCSDFWTPANYIWRRYIMHSKQTFRFKHAYLLHCILQWMGDILTTICGIFFAGTYCNVIATEGLQLKYQAQHLSLIHHSFPIIFYQWCATNTNWTFYTSTYAINKNIKKKNFYSLPNLLLAPVKIDISNEMITLISFGPHC